jgi:hypothetical protein
MIGQAGRDKAIIRDPSLAQVISSDVYDASAIPHKTDDLDTGGRILHPWTRLRALWRYFGRLNVAIEPRAAVLGEQRLLIA